MEAIIIRKSIDNKLLNPISSFGNQSMESCGQEVVVFSISLSLGNPYKKNNVLKKEIC